ncbi:hypothetical protein KQH61_03745 [bacterium]|nr:hypothetical protein [bacterium]MCB2179015.1 hypothetical protein [bacterium]
MENRQNKNGMAWGIVLVVFGLAAMTDMLGLNNDWIKVGLMGVGGLAVLAIYLTDRKNWSVLIPGYILLAVAAISSIAILDLLQGDVLGAAVLGLAAMPFLVVFLLNTQNWWALIPAWVLFSIGLMVLLIGMGILADALVALYVLSSIGLPFLVVFLLNRENWWALIPAYVMFSIGIMVTLIDANILTDFGIPAYVMLAIAFPFFVVYFSNRKQRWALIPGGITALMGLAFFAGTDLAAYVIPAVMVLLGGWLLIGSFRSKA